MAQYHPRPRFLTAAWNNLAMLNYEVDPAMLTHLVPAGTEIDRWQGRTLVSMVGFQFLHTRVLGVPIPWHRHFDEVNLRFYVRRMTPTGPQRGVVFVKEIVPRVVIAWVARWLYNENYVALPMQHAMALPPPELQTSGQVTYAWRLQQHWQQLTVQVQGPAFLPDEDSEETFITEHYWGYARQRDGATVEYQVEHPRWSVWRATQASLDCDVAGLYGVPFVPFLTAPPRSAFVATGSAVVVRCGRRLPPEPRHESMP
jgi:uncharacterized protein YqjF (DUF2071 family)